MSDPRIQKNRSSNPLRRKNTPVRFIALASLVLLLSLAAQGQTSLAGSALATTPATLSAMDAAMARLTTAAQRGVSYVDDDLSQHAPNPVRLSVHTLLADPAHCGRDDLGWTVAGGIADAYTYVVLRDRPVLGNRSQLAQLSFRSTQAGVPRGEHGLIELRLCRGTTADNLPLRIRIEDGRFYILGLNGDTVLAGSRDQPVFTMTAGTVYTLKVLLFAKAVVAQLEGADLPGKRLELVIPDRYRFIPGLPGFGLRPNPHATSGRLTVSDWSVTPVGPAENCALGVIGDSITAGMDREPEAESYVHLATRALGQIHVLNTGSGGSTTTLDLGRFPFEIAPFRPRLVWIEGGTNDIGMGQSAETIFENMKRQAALITWGGKPVFSTVPPRVLPSPAHSEELAQLNQLIRESGVPFVDRHALVGDPADPRQIRPEFRHADGIHITRPGQARIGEAATRLFQDL